MNNEEELPFPVVQILRNCYIGLWFDVLIKNSYFHKYISNNSYHSEEHQDCQF